MKNNRLSRRSLLKAGVTGVAATSAALAPSYVSEAKDGESFNPKSQDKCGNQLAGGSAVFALTLNHQLLDAGDIRARAIGNTLVGTVHDGEGYELFLRSDGAAILRMGEGRTEKGHWQLRSNGEIVSQWPTIANGAELVSRYYYDPDTRSYLNLITNGLRWSRFHIQDGDSCGLDM